MVLAEDDEAAEGAVPATSVHRFRWLSPAKAMRAGHHTMMLRKGRRVPQRMETNRKRLVHPQEEAASLLSLHLHLQLQLHAAAASLLRLPDLHHLHNLNAPGLMGCLLMGN